MQEKQLTNVRASGSDDALKLSPHYFQLRRSLEFIDNDELVEITPDSIRLRKNIRHCKKKKLNKKIYQNTAFRIQTMDRQLNLI